MSNARKDPQRAGFFVRLFRAFAVFLDVLKQGLRLWLPVLLGYLVQVSIVPYITLVTGRGVMPNMMIAVLSVLVVGKGRLQAFWAGAFYGMVTELMLTTVHSFNLLYYPAATFFVGLLTGDKSEDRMTRERNTRGEVKLMHPYLRTLLASLMYILLWEGLMMVYLTLRGSDITGDMLLRALVNTLLTVGGTMVIMIPFRKWLGVRHTRKQRLPEYTMQHF